MGQLERRNKEKSSSKNCIIVLPWLIIVVAVANVIISHQAISGSFSPGHDSSDMETKAAAPCNNDAPTEQPCDEKDSQDNGYHRPLQIEEERRERKNYDRIGLNKEIIVDGSSAISRNEIKASPVALSKPKLILHIGVMKTGTTYIQLELLRKKRWNRVYKKLLLDGYEVITQEYAPRVFERVIDECLLKGDDCNYKLWQDLLDMYKSAKEWNGKDNILQCLETFSMIPKPFNNYTRELFHSLGDSYDVRIVVFYRRLYEWIASLYTQYRKPFMFRTRDMDNPWKQDYDNVDDIKLISDWLEDILDSNSFHYITSNKNEFEDIFGPEKVSVLDYHAHESDGIEVEFICKGVPNATQACKEAKIIVEEQKDDPSKVVRRNTGEKYLLDHDLLIIEAFREKLLTGGRHNATLVLQHKLEEMNMSITELPKKCVSPERQLWLRQTAEFAETRYSSKPLSRAQLETLFLEYKEKLCSIDAKSVLANMTWRNLFASCEFQKNGC